MQNEEAIWMSECPHGEIEDITNSQNMKVGNSPILSKLKSPLKLMRTSKVISWISIFLNIETHLHFELKLNFEL